MKDKSKTKEQLIKEITEMRQRVAELEEHEAKLKKILIEIQKPEHHYQVIFDSIGDAIHIIDRELRIIFANRAFTEWIMVMPIKADIVGLNVFEAFPFLQETVRDEYEQVFKAGKPLISEECNILDGRKIYTESRKIPVMEEDRVVQIITVIRDITNRKQAEENLRESEENFRLSLDNSPLGIRIVTVEGETLYANRAIMDIYGYDNIEELTRTPLKKRYTPESYAEFQIRKKKRDQGEFGTSEYQISIVRKNGEVRHLHVFRKEIFWNGAKQFQVIYQDITERKQAEEELFRSQQMLQLVFDNIPQRVFWKDLNYVYQGCNRSLLEDAGLTSMEEIIGKNDFQLSWKKSAPLYRADDEEVMKSNLTKVGYEEPQDKPDGSQMWLRTSKTPLHDRAGHVIGILGTYEDITEQKRAEEILKESEERFRLAFDNANTGMCLVDLEGNLTRVNNKMCEIFGYTKEELEHMTVNDIAHSDDINKSPEFIKKSIHGEIGRDIFEKRYFHKNGYVITCEVSSSLVHKADGSPLYFISHIHDITERKLSEETLKKNQEELIKKNLEIEESRKNIQLTLEKLGAAYEELKTSQAKILQQEKMASIGQLAAGVAHEINNPMAFIASNLGTLDKYIRRLKDFIRAQSEVIKSLQAAEAIEKLEKKRKELKLDYTINDIDLLVKESMDGSERVRKIVQELNRFSRVDDAEYKDANINECIESSINIVENELKQKAALHKDYGNLPPTKCYPLKLNQVFINLLINAIQAIEEKGKIKIKTWKKDEAIWITISDTGCGISKENQSKIFEPFFTTKEAGKGTGLGLSISYDIIQRHKGEISFKSEKRKGTTFTICIPIV
jgi:two-component system NtrC family sensor kinase